MSSQPPTTADTASGETGGTRGLASRLPRAMRGYDCDATDQLLGELASRHAELDRECLRLRERTEALEAQLGQRRRQEEVMSRSLLAATSHAIEIREEARHEATLILKKARAEAAKRTDHLKHVEREQARAEQELMRLQKLTEDMQKGLAGFLSKTLDQLRAGGDSAVSGGAPLEQTETLVRALDAALPREGSDSAPVPSRDTSLTE